MRDAIILVLNNCILGLTRIALAVLLNALWHVDAFRSKPNKRAHDHLLLHSVCVQKASSWLFGAVSNFQYVAILHNVVFAFQSP